MGFFNRKKNNPFESYFANILEERKQLEISPNYQMSCNYLKHVFFSDAVTIEEIKDNPEIMQKMISVALLVGTENGIRFPDNYQSLSYTFIKSPTRKSYGYIVGFEDPM